MCGRPTWKEERTHVLHCWILLLEDIRTVMWILCTQPAIVALHTVRFCCIFWVGKSLRSTGIILPVCWVSSYCGVKLIVKCISMHVRVDLCWIVLTINSIPWILSTAHRLTREILSVAIYVVIPPQHFFTNIENSYIQFVCQLVSDQCVCQLKWPQHRC